MTRSFFQDSCRQGEGLILNGRNLAVRRTITRCEIVEGTRLAPGRVLRVFTSDVAYKCGGPNTACLAAWSRLAYTRGKRNAFVGFFTSTTVSQ